MPVELGRAAARQAKARDHLVEDQQRAVRARERAQLLQELGALQQQAVVGRHRLDDDGGDARALACEQRLRAPPHRRAAARAWRR